MFHVMLFLPCLDRVPGGLAIGKLFLDDERRRFKKETATRSPEAAKVLDVDNAVGDVSPVDALVSEEFFECEDDATMDEEESENGVQRKAGRGSAVYDLEYVVDMNAEWCCKPYPPISDKVVLDKEYKCEEPEIVRTAAQSLVHSKWPEMHSAFSKCIVWCMY
jgi:hypothetical protein